MPLNAFCSGVNTTMSLYREVISCKENNWIKFFNDSDCPTGTCQLRAHGALIMNEKHSTQHAPRRRSKFCMFKHCKKWQNKMFVCDWIISEEISSSIAMTSTVFFKTKIPGYQMIKVGEWSRRKIRNSVHDFEMHDTPWFVIDIFWIFSER